MNPDLLNYTADLFYRFNIKAFSCNSGIEFITRNYAFSNGSKLQRNCYYLAVPVIFCFAILEKGQNRITINIGLYKGIYGKVVPKYNTTSTIQTENIANKYYLGINESFRYHNIRIGVEECFYLKVNKTGSRYYPTKNGNVFDMQDLNNAFGIKLTFEII